MNKLAHAGEDIHINSRIVATRDITIIDEKLAVRIQDKINTNNVVEYFFHDIFIKITIKKTNYFRLSNYKE